MRRLLPLALALLILCGCAPSEPAPAQGSAGVVTASGVWPTDALPEPPGDIGPVQKTDAACVVQVSGLTEAEFAAYLATLQEDGFQTLAREPGTVTVLEGEDYPVENLLLEKEGIALSITYTPHRGEMGIAVMEEPR